MDASPAATPRLLLRADALAAGFSDGEIARLKRSGTWTALQRGAYLLGEDDLRPRARHALVVQATLARLRTPAVVSHASAAVLHGLPLWGVPLQQVHITRQPPARSALDPRLRSHVARLPDEHVVSVGACVVTSAARTVVDLARWLPFAPALAIADAALRSKLTTREELLAVLEFGRGTRGSRAAHRVVRAADARSESWARAGAEP